MLSSQTYSDFPTGFSTYGCAAHTSHTFMCAACLRQPILLVQERNIQLDTPLFLTTRLGYQDYMFRSNSWPRQVP
jgi:hypothetical protein